MYNILLCTLDVNFESTTTELFSLSTLFKLRFELLSFCLPPTSASAVDNKTFNEQLSPCPSSTKILNDKTFRCMRLNYSGTKTHKDPWIISFYEPIILSRLRLINKYYNKPYGDWNNNPRKKSPMYIESSKIFKIQLKRVKLLLKLRRH